ncbi:MAG TPA: tetratricopeptide repeat protein [Rhizomicrobium sp.]
MKSVHRVWTLCTIATLASAAIGAGANAAPALPLDRGIPESAIRYNECLDLVRHDADRADDEATKWASGGGGAAALHCKALALVELKRYPEAAQQLEEAASASVASPRAELLDQAGNAWLLAGKPARAEAALTSALALDPRNEDILSDRARERGGARNWTGAFEDLTAVLAIDPERADIYVLRASALHAQGKRTEARADIAHALDIYPNYPEALIERGAMRLEAGDRSGARADWQEAERDAPDSDASETARRRLAQLAALGQQQKRKQN